MTAFYNEIDPAAAHVLRALIDDGVIAPGVVDTRSIKDLTPDDLDGYTQCHFFAGGGLWSVAARLAGWADDRPLWTGSCPCQPFSAAGKGGGVNDPRHLWPDFFRLIRACRPPVVMGEQVAGAPGYGWFDGVRADLAGEGFASRVVDIPACAVDAPHIRQRLYWIAVEHAASLGRREGRPEHELRSGRPALAGANASVCLDVADADRTGSAALGRDAGEVGSVQAAERRAEDDAALPRGEHGTAVGNMADADRRGRSGRQEASERGQIGRTADERPSGSNGLDVADAEFPHLGGYAGSARGTSGACQGAPRPEDGDATQHSDDARGSWDGHSRARRNGSYWSDAEWLACHDGKARRTKPGLRLLVDGLPGRVGLWRIAGNAIVAPLAAEVIRAFMDVERAA